MNIDFTKDELDILIGTLTAALSDLRQEIYHTEEFEYKKALKDKKIVVENILHKLMSTTEIHA